MRVFWILIALSAARVFGAQPAENGDLIVRSVSFCACGFSWPVITVVSKNGKVGALDPGYGTDILRARDGSLYAPNGRTITVYSRTLQVTRTIDTPDRTSFVAMDAAQRLYAGGFNGLVTRYRPDGTVESSFSLANDIDASVTGGDLGRDQCTLYYTSMSSVSKTGRLRRYDVCRRIQLEDAGQIGFCDIAPPRQTAVRVASDGSVFVAGGCSEAYRFNGSGVTVYPLDSLVIAPTEDGQAFWTGSGTPLLVDVRTGAILDRGPDLRQMRGMELVGDGRASLAPLVVAQAPALSREVLAFLALSIAASAIRALRS